MSATVAPTGIELALEHASLRTLLRRVLLDAEHEDVLSGESGHIEPSTIEEIRKALA